MATAYLLRELEEIDQDLEITVFGDEREFCYNRVLLSKVLSGETPEQELEILDHSRPPAAKFLTNTRVVHIDPQEKSVLCEHGSSHSYDLLAIATGASVARPPLDCSGVEGVMKFRSLADTRQLRKLESRGKSAVVVGGGLLGLEAAHGLNELGFATTVVHRNPVLMNRQLDLSGGRQLQSDLESRGIGFRLDCNLEKLFTHQRAVSGVLLGNGEQLASDLLLFATGIVPNIDICVGAGLRTDRGVLINENLRTSGEDIYALGECAQFGEHCFGLVAPIREQARVLARQLSGLSGPAYTVSDTPTQLKISGIDIYRAGKLDDSAEQLLLRDEIAGVYRRLVVRDNKLIGALLVGDNRGGTWYADLIHSQRNIKGLRPGLMFGQDVSEAVLPQAAA